MKNNPLELKGYRVCVSWHLCECVKEEGDEVVFNPNPEFSVENLLVMAGFTHTHTHTHARTHTHTHTPTHTHTHTHTNRRGNHLGKHAERWPDGHKRADTRTNSSESHSIFRTWHKLSISWINERIESKNTHFLPDVVGISHNMVHILFYTVYMKPHSQQCDGAGQGSQEHLCSQIR